MAFEANNVKVDPNWSSVGRDILVRISSGRANRIWSLTKIILRLCSSHIAHVIGTSLHTLIHQTHLHLTYNYNVYFEIGIIFIKKLKYNYIMIYIKVGERGARWTTFAHLFFSWPYQSHLDFNLGSSSYLISLRYMMTYDKASMAVFCIYFEFLKIKTLGGSMCPMPLAGWPTPWGTLNQIYWMAQTISNMGLLLKV